MEQINDDDDDIQGVNYTYRGLIIDIINYYNYKCNFTLTIIITTIIIMFKVYNDVIVFFLSDFVSYKPAQGQFLTLSASYCTCLSTLCLKNRARNIMPHNSCKCAPILILFSPSHSEMNCGKALVISTTSPQICCRTTLRNLNVQLGNFTARYSMQMWRRIVYLQYLSTRDAKFCFLCLHRLICNGTSRLKIFCLLHTRIL